MKVPVAFQLSPEMWIPIKWLSPEDMGTEAYAEYTYDLNGGYVDASKGMPVVHMDFVILHEIRHAFWANCGYTDLFKAYSPNLEEAINEMVDFMQRGVVRINPDSKRWKWKEIEM